MGTAHGAVMTEERRMLVEAVRDLLADQASLEAVHVWTEKGDTSAFERRFAEDGWHAVGIPEPVGGHGGDPLDVALIGEQLGRAVSPNGSWMAAALSAPLLRAGPDLAGRVAGGVPVALAVDAAVTPAPHGSVSLRDGRVCGRVSHVLSGDRAELLVVAVRADAGVQAAVVELPAAGAVITPTPMLDGTRSLAEVELTDVPAQVVETDAFPMVSRLAAVLVAADALGAAGRMLDMTVAYTLEREQFGVPVGSFQAVKHAAATMLVEIEPIRSVVHAAAAMVGEPTVEADLHAAVAKAHATEAAVRVAETALTLHGAIGFTWEHDLQLLYKRAKLDRFLFGTPGEWRRRVAELLHLDPAVGV